MLVSLLLVGIIAQSNLIAIAACVLLILRFSRLHFIFPLLERRGLEVGLLFLLLSILVPIAQGSVTEKDLIYNITSLPGIMAIVGGAVATHMNGEGLKLLGVRPEIIFGLVIGSIFGIVFFRGVPVGPLMAAGIAALYLEIFYRRK
ncbi:MAG: membrane protein [Peptococcaceae bacterium BRH_c4a]|nr:MAG: membrane protein [Peptococcaceae bacterium BRH_c4a]